MDRAESSRETGLDPTADWAAEIARCKDLRSSLPPPAEEYLTPSGILICCDRLLRDREGRAVFAGSSTEGRPIWAFRFGPDRPGGIFLLSLLHACEWIGALALLETTRRILVEAPEIPLTIIPIANPDGARRAEEAAIRLKPRWPRGNARGVDLNRNFPPFHRSKGIWAKMPWYRPGPMAASEPETAAIVSLTRNVQPSASISFHSFGRWIFYPPAHTRRPWPQTAAHRERIVRAGGTRAIGYKNGQLGRWGFWFRAHGTEIDHLGSDVDSCAYLIEVSRGGIGRWGLRRLFVPFFAYNPPRAAKEVANVAGLCLRIVRAGNPFAQPAETPGEPEA